MTKQTRSKERVKKLGEVFTPAELVNRMLDRLPDGTAKDTDESGKPTNSDPGYDAWAEGKTYCDPSCGNGAFLVEIAKRKVRRGHATPLATIYGVDIMQDNVDDCRAALLAICGDTAANRALVEKNIVCANALEYDFSFGE